MTKVIFDKKDQLQKIQNLIVDGETLYAVYDMKGGGTGFVGITDLRLVFMDQAFIRKKRAVVSLPYTKITVVAAEDSGRAILGSLLGSSHLVVRAGNQEWNFEFRSNEKAHAAYALIMRNLLQTEAKGM
ncbi:MAG: PH domain-containing protein [Chloroflexi bacterium]|nr:PH domain-containing protein [Chloroflexota bacterium]